MGGTSHVAVADRHAHRLSLSLSLSLFLSLVSSLYGSRCCGRKMQRHFLFRFRVLESCSTGARVPITFVGDPWHGSHTVSRSSESALVQMRVDHLVRGAYCVKRKLDNSVQGFC